MSALEQYRYDGGRRPDFGALPTFVDFENAMLPGEAAAGEEADIRDFLKEKSKANLREIENLRQEFHAAKKRGLLIILQGMPYSGRTEISQYLGKGMKKGVKLYKYKTGERSHDFLWQMHRHTPKYGNICIMSDSIYAELSGVQGTERVRAFEKYLQESGITVVRIFLNVSSKCQKNRMLESITTKPGGAPRQIPQDKGWRKEFLENFAEVAAAATPETPWYIIPADNKWYTRYLVTELVQEALRECVAEGQEAEEPAADGELTAAGSAAAESAVEAYSAESAAAMEESSTEPGTGMEESSTEPGPAMEESSTEPGTAIEESLAESKDQTAEAEPVEAASESATSGESTEKAESTGSAPNSRETEPVEATSESEKAVPEEKPTERKEASSEKPVRRTRRRKPSAGKTGEKAAAENEAEGTAEETPTEKVTEAASEEAIKEKETEPAAGKASAVKESKEEAASAGKKTAARRPKRQGPPKTVEETLAKRRRRLESEG